MPVNISTTYHWIHICFEQNFSFSKFTSFVLCLDYISLSFTASLPNYYQTTSFPMQRLFFCDISYKDH